MAGRTSIIWDKSSGPTVGEVRDASHNGCHLCTIILSTWLQSRTNKSLGITKLMFTPTVGDQRFEDRKIFLEIRHGYMYGKTTHPRSSSLKMRFGCDLMGTHSMYRQFHPRGFIQEVTITDKAEDIAVYWLQNCLMAHTSSCGTGIDPILPRRVIDVRGRKPIFKPFLISSNGERERYATFSYVWGKAQIVTTATSTLPRHSASLDLEHLPKTSQDAIKLTLDLGLGYLWIDALCIVQNSVEDVDKEMGSMADIYKNATVTVAAIGGTGANDRITLSRNKLATIDCQISPNMAVCGRIEGQASELAGGTIHDRGWCYQEVQLAPRLLSCGGRELYFQCRQGTFREGSPSAILLDEDGDRLTRIFDEPTRDAEDAYSTWRKVVEKYSRLKLTYESDRLSAVSGLASRFASIFQHESQRPRATDYLAGIWRKDVGASLMWESDQESGCCIKYRAPSWSWAASEGSVSFYREGEASRPSDPIFGVLELSTVPHSELIPYGAVTSGKLVLHGPVTPIPEAAYQLALQRAREVEEDEDGIVLHTVAPGVNEMPTELGLEMVEWEHSVSKDINCICLLLCANWGLILSPVRRFGAGGLYQRVGYVHDGGLGVPTHGDEYIKRPGGIGYYEGHPDWLTQIVTII